MLQAELEQMIIERTVLFRNLAVTDYGYCIYAKSESATSRFPVKMLINNLFLHFNCFIIGELSREEKKNVPKDLPKGD